MEKVTVEYYQIPLYQLQKLVKNKIMSNDFLTLIPEVNYNVMYMNSFISSSTYICNVNEDFYFVKSNFNKFELKYHLSIVNAEKYPDAIIRFKQNILEKFNI